ncbi:putative endolysin [Curtobacterium phage Penoan]|nr:putative endolysin [Curtobacterium phage Penoan]
MLNGIDISGYQDNDAGSAVPADFVIVKATEGTTYVSSHCDPQVQGARKAGRLVGVYHFASGIPGAEAEADFFVRQVRGYIGQAILVLDWEANAIRKGPAYALAFLNRVHALTGVKPLIYMSTSVVNGYDWSAVVAADYGLWSAAYGSNPRRTAYQAPSAPSVNHWGHPVLHQYGSNFYAGGRGPLDIDVFYGDAATWGKYAAVGGKGAPAPSKPAPAPSKPTAGKLDADGILGPATIKRLQHDLGTVEDGSISRPSLVVKALQARMNRQGFRGLNGKPLTVDGLGFAQDGKRYETVAAFQRYMGTPVDGIMSKPSSAVVKAAQRRMNRGHI